eukprot:986068-Pleurochrysis_carterae.AAC.5
MRLRKAREWLAGLDTGGRNLLGQMPRSHATASNGRGRQFSHLSLILGTTESQTQESVFFRHIEVQLRRTHHRRRKPIQDHVEAETPRRHASSA